MKKTPKTNLTKSKKKYQPPKVTSEQLTVYGAICNGMSGGGRKASTGSPNFCNSTKLRS